MTTNGKAGDDSSPGTAIGNAESGPGASPKAGKPTQEATGQKRSKERGAATRSKKQPGKRPHQGGSSA